MGPSASLRVPARAIRAAARNADTVTSNRGSNDAADAVVGARLGFAGAFGSLGR
jgi:hypothetical protein